MSARGIGARLCGSLSTSLARCGRQGSVVRHARFGRLCSTLPPSQFWQVERITIGDDPENWRHIGFVVGRDGGARQLTRPTAFAAPAHVLVLPPVRA